MIFHESDALSNTAVFALEVAVCALLSVLLWVACAGIGLRLLPRPAPPRTDDEPAGWRQPGLAACVGLGLLLLLGGLAVLLRIPWWIVVVPFVVGGVVLATGAGLRIARLPASRRLLVFGGTGVAAMVLVALAMAPAGLRFPLNVCDDWRAYLPMARRLLDTNGLEEPWSARRLQSLGGFDLLRALPVAVFGNAGVAVAETVIGSVFLAGLFVANGLRSTWARIIAVGAVLVVPLLWVPRTNTTGILIGVPLLVGVLGATVELRRSAAVGERRDALRWTFAAALVTAALFSIRPNLGLLAAVFLTIGTVVLGGVTWPTRLTLLAAAGGGTVLAVSPWSVAMWRTAGAPLYPLFRGNLNSAAAGQSPVRDMGDLMVHTAELVRYGPYFWATVGAIVVAIVCRRVLADPALVELAAGATALVTLVFALATPRAPATTFIRYVAPMSAGVVVFLLCEVLRGVDAHAPRLSGATFTSAAAVAGSVALAVLVFSTVGRAPVRAPGSARLVARGIANDLGNEEVDPAGLTRAYQRAFRVAGDHGTIAAVDRPYLIDYGRDDVPSLDAPGFMTPDGGAFPFFTGPAAKIRRLRAAGYDTLVATEPEHDRCLAPSRIATGIRKRPFDRGIYDRFLDWGNDLDVITEEAPDAVRRFGPLVVVDLGRAERRLRA